LGDITIIYLGPHAIAPQINGGLYPEIESRATPPNIGCLTDKNLGDKIDKLIVKLHMNKRGAETMTRVVSSSEAKARLGLMMKWARENQDQVIIEVHGQPGAVLISYAEYQQLEKLKEQNRRKEALVALQALREEVAANTAKWSEKEAYQEAGVSPRIAQKLIDHDHQVQAKA
jgi:prevent-host-death family protein